jgi:hypothetical protein
MPSIKSQALLEHLLLQGALEISGFDPQSGETLYSITDKLESVSPEMYEDIRSVFISNMYQMMDQGPKIMQWRINVE